MQNPNRNRLSNVIMAIMAFLVLMGVFQTFSGMTSGAVENLTTSEFMTRLEEGQLSEIEIQIGSGVYNVKGTFKNTSIKKENDNFFDIYKGANKATRFETKILGNDTTLARVTDLALSTNTKMKTLSESSTGMWLSFVPYLILLIPMGFIFTSMMQGGGMGGGRGVMNFGKARTKNNIQQNVKVRFSDVAGADEEKQELVEIVEFLKQPKRFTDLGARIPAGVLLEGPPGTGKTLLAKAVAGEAGVPFFSISGSEFVEMFVGVGASRVRDIFDNAKKVAPAIIFIDEIDAVGRRRGTGMGGGNDEREQTLNQLLVEMDGFEGNEGIIVIAATNRSDVLDPALLRPGRFDRKVMVSNPDVKAREAILKVHARNKQLSSDIALNELAQKTPGFSGADLENLLNESALIAARRGKKVIDASDVDEAQDRIIVGLAKPDRERSEHINRIVAYHEAGHAIAGIVLESASEVQKVTIVPRGRAGGYVLSTPKEEQLLHSKEELLQRVVGLLAGRTAEEIVFNSASTGASDDFRQATNIVRAMVMHYGMSDKLGAVQYTTEDGYQKPYSEQTAYEIDQEVREITEAAHHEAKTLLLQYREQLDLIAEKLIEFETLDGKTIKTLFETGKMPQEPTEETVEPTQSLVEEALEQGEPLIAQENDTPTA
ncbi:MAG: ATP-dependent zinc metalloprotease FtsH [Aerococcaceae bacterium]|nr:ATP-dependent zinc metalloprotease FtsH [Aerococcaceae bacterium]